MQEKTVMQKVDSNIQVCLLWLTNKGMIRSRFDTQGNPIAFYDGLDPKGVQMIKEDIAILLKE